MMIQDNRADLMLFRSADPPASLIVIGSKIRSRTLTFKIDGLFKSDSHH